MPKVSDEHRAARRAHIMEAAMRRVAIDGYHKMTMADVIAESELSAGAVYGYFRSKQDLITAIATTVSALARDVVKTTSQLEPMPPAPEVLRLLTQDFISRIEHSPLDLTRVVVNTWAEAVRDEHVRGILHTEFTGVRANFADLLTRVRDAGHLHPDADIALATQTMFGLLPGFILQRLVLGDVDPDSYSAGLAALTTPPPG
ncbi:MAG: TetR/AcrR family transcriptional regulator [Ornithinimicrobium sp.]